MKNVILYIKDDDTPYKTHDSILRYLHAQIDNSLHYNWDIKDIIILSNFPFEYNGVKNINPKNLCEYNIWANKFYSLKELFEQYFTDDIWLHDYDVWQIDQFDFPKFDGMFAGCPYDDTHLNWNGGSFFFNKNSYPLLEYIVNFYEYNKDILSKLDDGRGPKWYSDEIILCDLRKIDEIKNLFYSLTPQYNLGMTFFESRYRCSHKPIKAIHAKLLHETDRKKYESISNGLNLIPDHLNNIVNKYKI